MELEKDTYPRVNYVSTITSQFLTPSVSLGNMSSIKIHRDLVKVSDPFDILKSMGLKGIYSYRKDKEYKEDELYFLINPNKHIYDRWFFILEEYLRTVIIPVKNGQYIPLISVEEVEKSIFVFTLLIHPRWKGIKTVVNLGQYSKINLLYPNYVDYFNNSGYKSRAYRVIMRDPKLIKEIEEDLDVTLDKGVELMDKPEKIRETLNW